VVYEYTAYGKNLMVTKYDSSTPQIAPSKVSASLGLGYALTRYAYDDANRKLDVYVWRTLTILWEMKSELKLKLMIIQEM